MSVPLYPTKVPSSTTNSGVGVFVGATVGVAVGLAVGAEVGATVGIGVAVGLGSTVIFSASGCIFSSQRNKHSPSSTSTSVVYLSPFISTFTASAFLSVLFSLYFTLYRIANNGCFVLFKIDTTLSVTLSLN